MKTLCIYHGGCLDGFTAAWIVKQHLGDAVEFHAGVYQNEPPDVTDRNVILVDFSYKREVMERMIEKATYVTIIDHHKSAIEDLRTLEDPRLLKVLDDTRSGAMLAWDTYFPDSYAPRLVQHVQDRDLWKFELRDTKEIMTCLSSYPMTFEIWDTLAGSHMGDLAQEGASIHRAMLKNIHEVIATSTRRRVIAGHDVPVVNIPYFMASETGNILCKGEKFSATYYDNKDGRHYSLRSDKTGGIDVSVVAEKFGGGGHKHAAGFRVPLGYEGDV